MNNQFIFIGRVCRNLVLKEAGSSKVLDVALAITRKYKNEDGVYDTDFIKCKAFGKTAEYIAEFSKVGDLLCLSGRVQTSSYTNQEDKKVYVTDFIISDWQFLSGSNKKEEVKEETKKEVDDPYASFGEEHVEELEDLPFN